MKKPEEGILQDYIFMNDFQRYIIIDTHLIADEKLSNDAKLMLIYIIMHAHKYIHPEALADYLHFPKEKIEKLLLEAEEKKYLEVSERRDARSGLWTKYYYYKISQSNEFLN